MWFGKKKMVDVRDLQKRGIVRIPKNEDVVSSNRGGFVDLRDSRLKKTTFSTETEGYNKKEVDEKIIELDNKIYKLEQRVELLERKVGVNMPNSPDPSVLKW
jgi:hypothetical protein